MNINYFKETDPQRFSAKSAKEVHVVEAPRGLVLDDMFDRLYNAKQSLLFQHSFLASTKFHEHGEHILQCQCDYCRAELACPIEVKGVLQAVRHGKVDPTTLSTRFAHHNTVGQQGAMFYCWATLA